MVGPVKSEDVYPARLSVWGSGENLEDPRKTRALERPIPEVEKGLQE